MTTSSVSKLFCILTKKKKTSLTVGLSDYFNEDLRDSEDGKKWFESCQLLWQQMKSQTEQLQEELNKRLFENLIGFLRKSHAGFHGKKDYWRCRMRASEIPTAALVLGMFENKLLEMKEKRRAKKPTKFELLRQDVVDFIDELAFAAVVHAAEGSNSDLIQQVDEVTQYPLGV
ncbi:origin recognition complex subunit 3-like [Xenopus laevis]|uniref:Origin recognition complex subunit 3-like n=1 Tax=Xenopus laevis TaxID=8355 RepID=A0A8J1KQU5_XENLA|nr:origin recognition complex subunit 3-like [Xenopus laevis]